MMSQCPDTGTSLSWFIAFNGSYCQWLYCIIVQSAFLAQWIIAFTLWLVEGQSSLSCGWIVHLQAFTLHALWADMQISQIKGYDIYTAVSFNSSHYKKNYVTVNCAIWFWVMVKTPLPRMLMLFSQSLQGGTQHCQEVQSLRKASGQDEWLMFFQEDIRKWAEKALN